MGLCGGRSCYASPIRRAARFAEIMWQGRDAPLVRTDSLKEAYLGWLQGMRQGANPNTPKKHIPSSNPTLTWAGCRACGRVRTLKFLKDTYL